MAPVRIHESHTSMQKVHRVLYAEERGEAYPNGVLVLIAYKPCKIVKDSSKPINKTKGTNSSSMTVT